MKLLDLFCGGGGAATGYYRAGFDIVGIDIEPQPDYPFPFIQADAFHAPVCLDHFDLIHASPPCQAFTPMSNRWRGQGTMADERTDTLAKTRDLLRGHASVIENVYGSSIRGFTLTGEMFGLGVHRPRRFETSWLVMTQEKPASRATVGIYGNGYGRLLWKRKNGTELRSPTGLEPGRAAMGIDWITSWDTLKEAIPPAYTEFIGGTFRHAP